MKSILKGSVSVVIAAVFTIGGFFVSHANAQLTLLTAFLWIVSSKLQMQEFSRSRGQYL